MDIVGVAAGIVAATATAASSAAIYCNAFKIPHNSFSCNVAHALCESLLRSLTAQSTLALAL